MKVKIGLAGRGKRSLNNLSHQVNTTSDYGFCQPILCRELPSDCNISMRIGQNVYLNPMVKPTFGGCSLRTYNMWVPIQDIWHPFESLLSAQTFRGSDAHYIPTHTPTVPLGVLKYWLCKHSRIYCYTLTNPVTSKSQVTFDAAVQTDCVPADLFTKWKTATGFDFVTYGTSDNMLAANAHDPVGFDWYDVVQSGSVYYLYAGIFSRYSRNLRKILLGCGYQLLDTTVEKTMLPLFAYYKAYFDQFAPQRNLTWKDTYCYGLAERMEQHNKNAFTYWKSDATCCTLFSNFMMSLSQCYYTINPDYVSAHIIGQTNSIAKQNVDIPYLSDTDAANTMTAGSAATNDGPGFTPGATQNINQPALNILKVLYEKLNAHTAIGGRIKDFMRSVYNSESDSVEESNFVGSQITEIDISAVMNQAETSQGYLAEYAARGVGRNPGSVFHFDTKKFGYYVSMIAVVPDAGWCQGVDPNLNHITRRSFFDEKLDSITLLPTYIHNIYGTSELSTNHSASRTIYDGGFGNVPNYLEYKCAYDVLNGDMSLGSTRRSYLPFTLNKIIQYTNVKYDPNTGEGAIWNVDPRIFAAGEIWRYIGKDTWFGNFNRVFRNDTDKRLDDYDIGNDPYGWWYGDDNFIINNYLQIQVTAPWKSTSESWQTGGEFGASMTVQKS